MGFTPKLEPEDKTVTDAIAHIVKTARAKGKRAGAHCLTAAHARRMAALGADLVTVSSDLRLMRAGAENIIGEFKQNQPS